MTFITKLLWNWKLDLKALPQRFQNKLITHSPKILKKVQDFAKVRMAKGSDGDHPFPILLRPFVRDNLLYSNEI